MGESLENKMSYEDYLHNWFEMKMAVFYGTYNNEGVNIQQRNIQLAEQALNLVVYTECSGGNNFKGLFMNYGHFCFFTKKEVIVVLPYVNDELVCAFPESQDDKVMSNESAFRAIKDLMNNVYKVNKKIVLYQVNFDKAEQDKIYDGTIITDYGKFYYNIGIDVDNSEI